MINNPPKQPPPMRYGDRRVYELNVGSETLTFQAPRIGWIRKALMALAWFEIREVPRQKEFRVIDYVKTEIRHIDSSGQLVGFEVQRASDGQWFKYFPAP